MIVITGANGKLGRGVVDVLLKLKPGEEIVASVRDPSGATALTDMGVAVRSRDFARPESLRSAFAGAD